MNCVLVVISSIMGEETTFLVKSKLTYWTTVDPSVMESFLVKVQVLAGGSSVVTDITAVEGLEGVSMFCLQVFLQSAPLLGSEVTVSDGALEHLPSWLSSSSTSPNFSNHVCHLSSVMPQRRI